MCSIKSEATVRAFLNTNIIMLRNTMAAELISGCEASLIRAVIAAERCE